MIFPIMEQVGTKRWEDEQLKATEVLEKVEKLRDEAVAVHQKLRIVCQGHGRTIANRWHKKQKEKRKAFFKDAFSDLREKPFDLPPRKRTEGAQPLESFINVDDLSTGSNFISLLATRAIYNLSAWVPYERNLMGIERVVSPWLICLDGDDEAYAAPVSVDEQAQNHLKGVRRGLVGPTQAVLVLDFQNKLLKLLHTSTLLILADVDLSKPAATELPLTLDDIVDLSQRPPTERYRLRAFSHPLLFSKDRTLNTLLTKFLDAQDHFILLRTDPVYFHARFVAEAFQALAASDWTAHARPDTLLEWDDVMRKVVMDEYHVLDMWSRAWRCAQVLFGLMDDVSHNKEVCDDPNCGMQKTGAANHRTEGNGYDSTSTSEDRLAPLGYSLAPEQTQRILAELELILDQVAHKRTILEQTLCGAPGTRHLFGKGKGGRPQPLGTLDFNTELSRKEAGSSAILDLIDTLIGLADEPRDAQGSFLERFYAIVDEMLQKDAHQRGRITAQMSSTLSMVRASEVVLQEIVVHPDRHRLWSQPQIQTFKMELLKNIQDVAAASVSTHVETAMFQEKSLFGGVPPSPAQERKAQKALQAVWEKYESCELKGWNENKKLRDLYKDCMPPESTSPGRPIPDHTTCTQKPLITLIIKKKNFRVFNALFAPTSEIADVDIPWDSFLQAMRAIGFKADRTFGMEWRFTPSNDSPWPMYPISLQEPMSGSKILWQQARFISMRLFRHYGLGRASFILGD